MTPEIQSIGRVLRSSTTQFAIGRRVLETNVPRFGDFVKVPGGMVTNIIGLIYDVSVNDDAVIRQLILAEGLEEEIILDQQENRLVPIEVSILIVGYQRDKTYIQSLPPQPPISLDKLEVCNEDEVIKFTENLNYLRLIIKASDIPTDELIAATLTHAAEIRAREARRDFLIKSGREVARLMNSDLIRLDAILQQLRGVLAT